MKRKNKTLYSSRETDERTQVYKRETAKRLGLSMHGVAFSPEDFIKKVGTKETK